MKSSASTADTVERLSRNRLILLAIVSLAAAAIVANIGWRLFLHPRLDVDFKSFWTAGKVWQRGGDPYAPGFSDLATTILGDGRRVLRWYYPPNWWPICVGLAALPFGTAVLVWRGLTYAALLGATVALVFALSPRSPPRVGLLLAAVAAAMVAVVEPTGSLIEFGQSTALLFPGLCLVLIGFVRGRELALFAGLVLLGLKPQLALPFFLFAFASPAHRGTALAAAAASMMIGLPHLLRFGFGPTLAELTGNMNLYGRLEVNDARNVTGPIRLVAALTGWRILLLYQLGVAILAAGAVTLLAHWRDWPRLPVLALLTAATVALVPLHIYEMDLLLPGAILLIAVGRRVSPLVAAALLLLLRPSPLEVALGVHDVIIFGHLLASCAGLLLLAEATIRMAEALAAPRPAVTRPAPRSGPA